MIQLKEKKVSIPLKNKRSIIILSVILILMGINLIFCGITQPSYFPFLKDLWNRTIYVLVGIYLLYQFIRLMMTQNDHISVKEL